MSQLQLYLINNVNPALAVSNEFSVGGYSVSLVLAGAGGGDAVQIQVLAGPNETQGQWADLSYNGAPVQLTSGNSQYELNIPGRYRVHYTGSTSTLQVWMQEGALV
jgi:hypothetical protein